MAMIRNGVKPTVRMRFMIANEYPPKVMRIGIVFPNRICSTYRQLAIWESTVAIAAPRTPRCRTKINTGSSSRFRTAPSRTDFIPSLAKPWQITNWFRPVDKSANTEPET